MAFTAAATLGGKAIATRIPLTFHFGASRPSRRTWEPPLPGPVAAPAPGFSPPHQPRPRRAGRTTRGSRRSTPAIASSAARSASPTTTLPSVSSARPADERGRRAQLAPDSSSRTRGGSGHAEQVFLRRLRRPRGAGPGVQRRRCPHQRFGANYHGNGYADTHASSFPSSFTPYACSRDLPYAPQQGDFAVAGSADYQLGLDRRGLTAEYSVGNFGTQRMLVLYGPADAPTGTFAGAELFTTDGFGANRQAKRGTAIGQWETPLGRHGTLRVNATAYATEFNNAGVVREDRRIPGGPRRLLRDRGPRPDQQHGEPRVACR